MKRLFLTLAIAAIGFTGSYAQTKAPKEKMTVEQKAEKSTAKLQKQLSLNADQKQKVYAIELDKYKKAEQWHQESKETRKAQKEKHEAVKKDTETKLGQILTADQKKKLEAVRAAHKEENKDKKHHHKGDAAKA